MKVRLTTTLIGATASALVLGCAAFAMDGSDYAVPYPNGYRDWTHVKSMVIQDGHPLVGAFGGIHHIYGNEKAMTGYKSKGRAFPDGSVIVFDLLEDKPGGGAIQEGARKVVGVMHKDSRKYASTGGWGFEGFKGDSKTDRAVGPDPKAAASACFGCHVPQKDNGYVYSNYRP